jgi:hypothetical protein
MYGLMELLRLIPLRRMCFDDAFRGLSDELVKRAFKPLKKA